jgi:hypothetical protein
VSFRGLLAIASILALVLSCGARTELGFGVPTASGVIAGDDAGVDAGPDGATAPGVAPIDPTCTGAPPYNTVFPPYVPLVPPDEPADCGNGFELGDAVPGSVYVLDSNQPAGAAAITLDVDFATYKEPDGVLITGTTANGETYTLLDSCRLQTSSVGDQTGGTSRPADDTIRQFRISVEPGTVELVIDFAGVVSPMYIQVLGLCDFDVVPFPDATWWQAVP